MKHGLFLLSIVLFSGLTAYAEDNENNIMTTNVEIKNALGFSLGEKIPEIRATKNSRNNNGFIAPKPFRNFTRCYLSTTHDKKIYMISSNVYCQDEEDAKAEFKLILGLLEKKYQCTFSNLSAQQYDEDTELYKIQSSAGQKFIGLSRSKQMLRVFYVDEDLLAQSDKFLLEKEREQNKDSDAL